MASCTRSCESRPVSGAAPHYLAGRPPYAGRLIPPARARTGVLHVDHGPAGLGERAGALRPELRAFPAEIAPGGGLAKMIDSAVLVAHRRGEEELP